MTKTRIYLKKNIPRANVYNHHFRREVGKDWKRAGERTKAAFDRVVENWSTSTRPQFSIEINLNERNSTVLVVVNEADPERPIWLWIDKTGTKPHTITPKADNPTGLLWFSWGGPGSYQAKTGANPARFGGPGRVQNPQLVVTPSVDHPGFEPRHFTEDIKREAIPEFRGGVINGDRRALRRATKEGR